jgi:hypothetical protein
MRPGEYRLFKMIQLPRLGRLTLCYCAFSKVALCADPSISKSDETAGKNHAADAGSTCWSKLTQRTLVKKKHGTMKPSKSGLMNKHIVKHIVWIP